jgi:hypothetical protein
VLCSQSRTNTRFRISDCGFEGRANFGFRPLLVTVAFALQLLFNGFSLRSSVNRSEILPASLWKQKASDLADNRHFGVFELLAHVP